MKPTEEEKEKMFDLIEEYMELEHDSYTIKVDAGNKEKVFAALCDAGERFSGFKENSFSINGITKRKLDKKGIIYEIVNK